MLVIFVENFSAILVVLFELTNKIVQRLTLQNQGMTNQPFIKANYPHHEGK